MKVIHAICVVNKVIFLHSNCQNSIEDVLFHDPKFGMQLQNTVELKRQNMRSSHSCSSKLSMLMDMKFPSLYL